jgi:hypothetical protein
MSKAYTEDITTRKPAMILHARNHVDVMKDDHTLKSKRETVSLEETLKTEMIVNQALIDLLIAKGIITQEELLDRIRELRKTK